MERGLSAATVRNMYILTYMCLFGYAGVCTLCSASRGEEEGQGTTVM